jgi:hypothetical protein
MTWFAWTTIKSANDDGSEIKLEPGDEASAGKLNIDDEEFSQLIDARSVRKTNFPDMPEGYTGSAKDWILEARKNELKDIEDNFGDEDVSYEASDRNLDDVAKERQVAEDQGNESEVEQPSGTVTEFS